MRSVHGVRPGPGSSPTELRVRLTNRTDLTQTVLRRANAAVAVQDDYQSFFPADAHVVAGHAKRAVTGFPRADGIYYGRGYPARVDAGHDLTDSDGPYTELMAGVYIDTSRRSGSASSHPDEAWRTWSACHLLPRLVRAGIRLHRAARAAQLPVNG